MRYLTLAIALCLFGCLTAPRQPQRYHWNGETWIEHPDGQYVWNGHDMEFAE